MGRVITLFKKRAFDYTFLDSSSSQIVTIRKALHIIQFYYYWLGIRVHNRDIGTGNFTLALPNTLPSAQDPQEFTQTGIPALTLTISSGTSVPSLLTDTTNQLGPFLKVTLTATRVDAGKSLYAELSAVLYCRAV